MIIVIPMAGRGSRYLGKGYDRPKPLIEIMGKPMLYHAFHSVADIPCRKLIFIALREHQDKYNVRKIIEQQVTGNFELILLEDITEGQLCTVLAARDYFIEGEGLLIASSDSYIVSNLGNDIQNLGPECAGLISVIDIPGEQWSFAKADKNGNVLEVAEKKRISSHASTGLYYFADAKLFEEEADRLIGDKDTTRGEYFVMPLYNRYLKKTKQIRLSLASEMWDMGTPEAKEIFEKRI